MFLTIRFSSYVIEDGSPYLRSGKQNQSFTAGKTSKVPVRDVVDDLADDAWNFMSFYKKDFIKDSVPDQQLSLQDLTIRYKGERPTDVLSFCIDVFVFHIDFSVYLDTKKSVLKTMSAMDLDKINVDLVENLLEWIVSGKHNYPAG